MSDSLTELLRGIMKFVLEWLIWDTVLFNLGRIALLLCTLGRYPRGAALHRDANRIAAAGALVLLATWSAVALHNHLTSVRSFAQGSPGGAAASVTR
jgi:hypothetical protein